MSRALSALLFLATLAGTAPFARAQADLWPELTTLPPPLLGEGPGPALVFESLTPQQTHYVADERRVLTLEEETREEGRTLVFRVQSLGILDVPLGRAIRVFADLGRYPGWVTLSPSYKEVGVLDGRRIRVGIGKSDRSEIKTRAVHQVRFGGDLEHLWAVQWVFQDKVRAFQPGSFLDWTLQAHPSDPDRTLVLHTQETRVRGMLARRYLTGDSDEGGSRHWWDAAKHARRIHWAAAVGAERIRDPEQARNAYAVHYEREFGSKPPYMWESYR